MASTIYDVAKKAGVGVGTVSRAINNSPHIRPETKVRILNVIKELGFTPHSGAKRLSARKLGIIAAIMPFYTGHFFQELLSGIQQVLTEYENDLIIYNVEKTSKVSFFFDRVLREKRADGLLAISIDIPDEYIEKFASTRLPIVAVDREYDQLNSVLVNNVGGAKKAVEHLLELGHKRIAMIAGEKNSIPGISRYQGYRQALQDAGIAFDPTLHITANAFPDDIESMSSDGYNARVGWLAMEVFNRMGEDRPTAVFAGSDIQAIGAIKYAREHGILIPEDLAIIGFDDIELSSYLSLTTMQQPMREMGRAAVQIIMDKIEHGTKDIRHVILKTRLCVRGSTQKGTSQGF